MHRRNKKDLRTRRDGVVSSCWQSPAQPNQTETMNETESLRARIASLEAEITSLHKRRAAIEAMEAYKTHATTHAQEIAGESSGMLDKFLANPNSYPVTAKYLALRNEADRLRKEIQP